MRRILAWVVALTGLALATPAFATPSHSGTPAAGRHYVEFRSRDGASGHTYVVYGKTDGRGRVITARAAGFYPDGAFSETALTVFLPFRGEVGLQPADRRDPPSVVYRVYVDAGTYARLATDVQGFRNRRRSWHLVFFNCNAFTARVARSIGLRAPSTLQFPDEFILNLYYLNRSRHAGFARVRNVPKAQ